MLTSHECQLLRNRTERQALPNLPAHSALWDAGIYHGNIELFRQIKIQIILEK